MTAYEISTIIASCGLTLGFIIGFLSEGGGSSNTYEKLYKSYSEGKTDKLRLEVELAREETKQMVEQTKQMEIKANSSMRKLNEPEK
jgi:hypothetical protein